MAARQADSQNINIYIKSVPKNQIEDFSTAQNDNLQINLSSPDQSSQK